MVFSTKALIYTCITGAIGLAFYYIFAKLFNLQIVGIIIALIFALIGFSVGTFKIPDSDGMEISRKLGGEEIDKAFLRWFKFKRRGNVIYTYLGKEDK